MMALPGTPAGATWLRALLPCLLLVLVVQAKPQFKLTHIACSSRAGNLTKAALQAGEKHLRDGNAVLCQIYCRIPFTCTDIYESRNSNGTTVVSLCSSCGSCIESSALEFVLSQVRNNCFKQLNSSGILGATADVIFDYQVKTIAIYVRSPRTVR
ncbi:unnamed protein product [Calypogeia fissa]